MCDIKFGYKRVVKKKKKKIERNKYRTRLLFVSFAKVYRRRIIELYRLEGKR